jgi:hypothetical protein
MSRNYLLVFAKAPVPGRVKTRMQPFLTAEQAAQLHRQLVKHCLQQTVSDLNTYTVELWVDELSPCWLPLQQQFDIAVFKQCGEDLGARMAYGLADVLAQRADAAVIIGTDCPDIDSAYIHSAFELLAAKPDCDVVLGPAEDGGYVLLGLKQFEPELFVDIRWGSEYVLTQTANKISGCGLRALRLPALMDIDRPEDLQLLQQRLPAFNHFKPVKASVENNGTPSIGSIENS